MPGNRQIYDQAMNAGHNAAWAQEWEKAIYAYGRAVQEFPEDPAAHNSLGLALLQARRLEDALKVYTRAHQLGPDDPIPLEKSADVLERLGRLKEAAQQYINVAEIYLGQRDIEKAIGNWERATRLTSGLVHIHQRLALAYERIGRRNSAIREYITLAFNFQRANRKDMALQAVERGRRLDPKNPQLLNTKAALEAGKLIPPELIERDTDERPDDKKRKHGFDLAPDTEADTAPDEADSRGPIGEAIRHALSDLATAVLDNQMQDPGSNDAVEAITYQNENLAAEAVGAYQRAIAAGMHHPAIYLNLGAILLELERWDDAIPNLEKSTSESALAAGALHGLSKAYVALGNPKAAAYNLIQSLRLVDVGMTLGADEAGQIADIYDRLTAAVEYSDDIRMTKMNERFLDTMSGPEWKRRIPEIRHQLVHASRNNMDLVDVAGEIDKDLTEGLNLIDRYLRQGLLTLAMDQAHYMLEKKSNFLPIHMRIGKILLERDYIPAAIEKYNMIARTHLARDDIGHAAEVLQEALNVAPMDTSLYESLIELLEQQDKWDEVLDVYVDLADAYYQLADMDSARATFQSAIQIAKRISAPIEKSVHIMHRMGDIDVSRLDLRQAMRTYEQIRKLDPHDDRARRALVDLNYRLNDPVSAVHELDGLLRVYAKEGRANRIIQVLEEEVTRYPQDMALRSRLAAVYRQTGSIPKAIEQLDSLAELQLDHGMHSDAMVTIRRIISLNPEQVGDYKRLLKQLSG
ncbi:MAG: tetratricopeptide repeat protein [Anaerolineae bacterium]|nr:tetratricopeptide repeat protein [Anaerolineae bacterium]